MGIDYASLCQRIIEESSGCGRAERPTEKGERAMEPMTVRGAFDRHRRRPWGEEAVAERTITGVETDSRAVHEGDLSWPRGRADRRAPVYCQCWRPAPPAA